MKHLLASGGVTNHAFGILTTPSHKGIPEGVINGMAWAADNEAYTKPFDADIYFHWLYHVMLPYRDKCLFVTVPDCVGNSTETLRLFEEWHPYYQDWITAFVAQDGQDEMEFPDPDLWQVLFIGGTNQFKDSYAAISCIKRAQALGKRIHIGRVNYWQRYQFFSKLEGSDEFTCDGTAHRFITVGKAIKLWSSYADRAKRQMGLDIPYGDSPG